MKITIIGTGYVGLVTGATFAEIGHHVMCVDNDEAKVASLRRMEMPIYEEGLQELVRRNVNESRLSFNTSIEEGTAHSTVIFMAVGTPPGYGGKADMSYVERVGREVAANTDSYRLLVEKSTVPVKTNEQLKRTMNKYLKSDIPFDIASNPEFLREGSAIHDAFHPDRIVVGVESEQAADLLREVYKPIVETTDCPYMEMNIASAELTKHASNSFLAMKISFINAVSRICELAGADVEQVARGMGLDSRIGPAFLKAGTGYGGSCFPKDIDAFVRIGDELGYNLGLLKEVQKINASQKEHVMRKLQQELWVLEDKTIGVLGLAFKPGTDDIREAPSLYFVPELLKRKAAVKAWDPQAVEKFAPLHSDIQYSPTPMDCAHGTDGLLILTDWPEVAGINLDRLKEVMACPIIVDGRNMFDPAEMAQRGFIYHCVGRG